MQTMKNRKKLCEFYLSFFQKHKYPHQKCYYSTICRNFRFFQMSNYKKMIFICFCLFAAVFILFHWNVSIFNCYIHIFCFVCATGTQVMLNRSFFFLLLISIFHNLLLHFYKYLNEFKCQKWKYAVCTSSQLHSIQYLNFKNFLYQRVSRVNQRIFPMVINTHSCHLTSIHFDFVVAKSRKNAILTFFRSIYLLIL